MRKLLFGSLAALAAGGGLAWGQYPAPKPVGKVESRPTNTPMQPPPGYAPQPGMMVPPEYAAQYGLMPQPGQMPPPGMLPPGMNVPPGMDPNAAYQQAGYMAGGGGGGGGHAGCASCGPQGGGGGCGPQGCPPGGEGNWSVNPMFAGLGGDAGGPPAHEKCYGSLEYLLWFFRPGPSQVPLVTNGSPIGGAILGNNTTYTTFGGNDFNFKEVSGMRATVGLWKGCDHRFGYEVSGFVTQNRTLRYDQHSDINGFPVIARPFTEAIAGAQSALLVSFPGYLNAGVNVTATSQFWGVEGDGMLNLFRSSPLRNCGASLTMLGGFRYLNLSERLEITSVSNLLTNTPVANIPGQIVPPLPQPNVNTTAFGGVLFQAPAQIGVSDRFYTQNSFYGGSLGGRLEMFKGPWTLNATGRCAVGTTRAVLDINGASALVKPGVAVQAVQQGGLYAQSSNIGRTGQDLFAFAPEGAVQIGYQLFPCFNVSVGYNFLYLSKVLRPGDQINPNVNSTLVPTSNLYGVQFGPLQPQRQVVETNFWAQGMTVALQLKF